MTTDTPPADAALADAVLAPCPWCGTEPNTSERTLHGGPCWSVYCRSHDCEVAPAADFYETEAAAITAWNTRPFAPPSEGAAMAQEYRDLAGEIDKTVDAMDKHGQPAGSVVTAAQKAEIKAAVEWAREYRTSLRIQAYALESYIDPGDKEASAACRRMADHILTLINAAGLLEEGA